MGKKDRTVSFRVDGERSETLRSMAEERDLSLSSMFREYVDEIVAHDGRVEIVPERDVREEATSTPAEFPPTVTVPQSFVREHERLELECEHLREQLSEHRERVSHLEGKLESLEERRAEMVRLEDVDYEAGTSLLIE